MANLPSESVRKAEVCPGCQRQLEGVVVVSSAMVGGINFVVMEETPDRNWIECDACGKVVCKTCCVFPDSGYCDRCYFTYKIEPNLGCFWHGHKNCRKAKLPETRKEFWEEKITGNTARDRKNLDALQNEGWRTFVVWTCKLKNLKETQLAVQRLASAIKEIQRD